jgi:hypothetical protein
MRDETEVQHEAARAESRRAYVEALCGLSDEDLQQEFRFRESMPDFRSEIMAEVQRRKHGVSPMAAKA